jgi:tight adherence protein B
LKLSSDLLGLLFFLAIGVTGLVAILIGYLSSRRNTVQKRLSTATTEIENQKKVQEEPKQSYPQQMRNWLNDALASITSEKMKIKLSGAYWPISASEFVLIQYVGTVFCLILGWIITKSVFFGLVLSVVAFLLPSILLDRSIYNRQKQFQDQLMDVLILIKGSVQAGYSLLQSLNVVVDELKAPASEEFRRVLKEVKIGLSLNQALRNLSDRMESDDLTMIVTAISINTEVGGNLSTMLSAVITTIRDRMYLFREVRAITSYGRYTGYLLTLLPFIAGLLIFLISPSYFDNVRNSTISQFILIVAFIGMVLGNIWIRRIVRIKV